MSASELPCLVAQSDSQDTLELFAHVLHFLTRTPDVLVSCRCDIEDGAPACALPPLVPLAPCAAARLAYFSPPWPGGAERFGSLLQLQAKAQASPIGRPVLLGQIKPRIAAATRYTLLRKLTDSPALLFLSCFFQ